MRNLYHYAEQSEVHFASDLDKTRQGMRFLHVAGASREVADRHQPDLVSRLPACPTARVHVIGKPFLMMPKCRSDGRKPSQRVKRAVVVVLWC
jgi:hypothetical protein